MIVALVATGWTFDLWRLLAFGVLFLCGVAIAYSLLLMLSSTSVWLVRNQNLMELWWLFSTLMRHPRQIFNNVWWAEPLGRFFTLIVPVLLVVSVPAETMVKVFEPVTIGGVLLATVVLLWLSRRVFLLALRSYRSASS